jgi:hypothetical protein
MAMGTSQRLGIDAQALVSGGWIRHRTHLAYATKFPSPSSKHYDISAVDKGASVKNRSFGHVPGPTKIIDILSTTPSMKGTMDYYITTPPF